MKPYYFLFYVIFIQTWEHLKLYKESDIATIFKVVFVF